MRRGFKGATLIKCTGEDAIDDSLVLIDHDKITYAGENDGRPLDGYNIKDVSGMSIMPGMVEAHIHFSGTASGSPTDWMAEDNNYEAIVATTQAKTILDYGFTAARDFSRYGLHLKKAINTGIIEGPRIFTHGRGMCRSGGHGDWPFFSPEIVEAQHPWAIVADTEYELRKTTRQLLRQDVDAIKIWATGGGYFDADRDMDIHYSKGEIDAVVEEATYLGKTVSAHCENNKSAKLCISAGISCLEHGDDIDDEDIEIMAEKGIFIVPTLTMFTNWYAHATPPYRPILDEMPGDTPGEKEINRVLANFRKCKDAGVPIAIGADVYANDVTPYGQLSLDEIYSFVDAGCTEMETLIYATYSGSKLIGMSDIIGTIEAGKYADIIILNKNPLNNIRNLSYENIETVIKNGKEVRDR